MVNYLHRFTIFFMNYFITHFFNSLVGAHPFFDSVVMIIAQILPWISFGIFFVFVLVSHKRNLQPFLLSIFTLIGLGIVNSILKISISQERPFEIYQTIEPLFLHSGLGSFPSGHAMVFAGIATLSFFLVRRVFLWFFVSGICIGISRIIAGVHFAYDIFAGWVLGVVLTIIFLHLYKFYKNTKKRPGSSIFSS